MLEIVNSVACFIMMGFSLPVAMAMGNHGMWFHRLSLVAVQFGLFMQMTNPFIGWLPEITWTGVYLNAASAFMLCIWWRRAWLFVRSYLGPQDKGAKRRKSDWPMHPVQHAGLSPHWHGGPKT